MALEIVSKIGTDGKRIQVEQERADAQVPEPVPTAEQLDAQAERSLLEFEKSRSREKVLAQAIFDLANQVRALQGRQEITGKQFKAWLKSKMK